MGRERRTVVRDEVLAHQRMIDRRRPLGPRVARVGAQEVIQACSVTGSHAAECLIPVCERFALTTSTAGSTRSLTRQHSRVGREMAPPDGLWGSPSYSGAGLGWYAAG